MTDMVAVLWRHKLTMMVVTLLGAIVSMSLASQMLPIFIAQGQIVVRSAGFVGPDVDNSFYSAVVSNAVISTERNIIGSRGLATRIADSVDAPPLPEPLWRRNLRKALPAVVRQLHLPETWLSYLETAPETADDKITQIQHALSSDTGRSSTTSVLNIYASTTDPVFSAEIVNKALTFYMDGRVIAQRTTAENVATALRERLRQISLEIHKVESLVATMMRRPGMIESAGIPSASREVALLGARLAEARSDLASTRAAAEGAARLQQSASENPAQLVALLDQGSASTAEIRRQLARSQADVSRLQAEVGTRHPRYLAAKITLDSVAAAVVVDANRIVVQRQAEATAAAEVVASLESQLSASQKRTSNIGPAVLNVDREREDLSNLRKISGLIEDRLIALAAQPIDANAQVLTWAKPPKNAAFPKKILLTVGGVLIGLTISSAKVLIGEYRSRFRGDPSSSAANLPGRVLGSVPRLRNGPLSTSAASAFQAIALELDYVALERKCKVFAITSGLAGEGKTTVTAHLALALSRLGRRVLVINCDSHGRPRSDWRSRQSTTKDDGVLPAFTIPDGTNLHIITALDSGADPVTFLNSSRFIEIVASARLRYDLIICDTPPLFSVPDAVVVGRASDGVLLVSTSDNISREPLANGIFRRLSAIGRPLCGIIVTKADTLDVSYTSYKSDGRHGNMSSIIGDIENSRRL